MSSAALDWFKAKAGPVVEALRASLELEHAGGVSVAALGRAKAVGSHGAEPSSLGELCEIAAEGIDRALLRCREGVDPKRVAHAARALGMRVSVEESQVWASVAPAQRQASARRCASRRMPAIEELRSARRKAKKEFPQADWGPGSSLERALAAELARLEEAVEAMVVRAAKGRSW